VGAGLGVLSSSFCHLIINIKILGCIMKNKFKKIMLTSLIAMSVMGTTAAYAARVNCEVICSAIYLGPANESLKAACRVGCVVGGGDNTIPD
jgi:hypothetical protein